MVTIKITLLKCHLETLHTSLEPLISNNTSLSDPKPNSSDPRRRGLDMLAEKFSDVLKKKKIVIVKPL